MQKKLLFIVISLAIIVTTETNASISVTGMNSSIKPTLQATGSINDDGTMGTIESIDRLSGFIWSATQETGIINNSNNVTWAGANALGSWDFTADIANMSNNQVAVGMFWNWSAFNDVAILAVFDCTTGAECLGQAVGADGSMFGGMQSGPFPAQVFSFNGVGTLSAVPVPAAAWLMGSGFLGLIALARRNATKC